MNLKNVMSNAIAKLFSLVNIAIILSLAVTSYAAENPPDISPPTHVAGNGSEEADSARYVPDEILVKFKEGVPEEKKEQLHGKHGGKKLKEYKELRLHRVKLKEKGSVKDAVADYKSDPDVEYAEPNYILSVNAIPNDPMFNSLWGLSRILAHSAWDSTTGSQDVAVAVLDTGVDYNHADLKNNIWSNSLDPVNGIDDDGNGYLDDNHGINTVTGSGNPMDDNGHGTHVAGTIGASGNNAVGVTGVNWSVKIIPCKFSAADGRGSVADAVEALEYLKQLKERTQDPVKIAAVNASFGTPDYTQAFYDAIKAMGDTLIVAAAGNDGKNAEFSKNYPASYELPNIISVAATDSADLLASFSNYGSYLVHTGAPGQSIVSTWPGGQYQSLSGTSMAAPHVTGLAALLKAQDPFRTGFQIKNLILSAGDAVSGLEGKTSSGKRINAYASTNCIDKQMLTLGRLPFLINPGQSYTLSAYSVNCAAPVGPVSVTASSGGSAELTDGGSAPDLAAGDGTFTGTWTAGESPALLTFSSPEGSKTVTVPPLKAAFHIADAKVDVPYSQALAATGGWAPFTWAIKSGTLPAGLSLDPASGVISGTAGAAGSYRFTAEAVDAKGGRAAVTLTMRVVTEEVEQAWGRSFGGDGSDEGNAVATDPDGNSYVAGDVYNGFNYDAVLLKYDRAGQLLWARSYDTGKSEVAYSIARDPNGNLYLAGVKGDAENLLLKYDANGNLLWSQVWNNPQLYGRSSWPKVAADGAGNVYTVSGGFVRGQGDAVQLDRFDSSGNRIWSKTHQSIYTTIGNSVALDAEGNVYFGGSSIRSVYANGYSTAYYDYLVAKYDSSGNVLWSKTLAEGIWSRVEGIAVYGGSLFATGWTSTTSSTYGVTMKFDSAGNMLWKSATTGGSFFSNAIALAAGDVYIAGELQTSSGGVDFQTVKYDSAGNEKWKKTMDAGGVDSASGIVADIAGFTVTGYGKYGDNSEIVTARYNDSKVPVDDLSVTGVSGELTGATLAYALTVKNSGTGSPTAAVSLRFSRDAVPSADDYVITLLNTSLPGGTAKMLTGSVTVPPTVPTGTYYLTAFADPADLLYEIDETNNGSVAAGTYDVIASGSDLEVGAMTASVAGGNLSYSVTVKNSGNIAAAASTTGIYLWSGETVSRFENRVASVSTGPIPAGGEVVLTGTVPVPSTIPVRSYLVVANSDAASVIAETDESNNAMVGNQVTLSNDLSISALSGTINGTTLSYAVNVMNSGTANPTAAVSLVLSSDTVYSTEDRVITTINAANVPGGTEKALSGSVTLPTPLPAGKYYLLAMADPKYALEETDETNNAAAAGPYDVAAIGSDLQVGAITASVVAGNLEYSVTVKNAGNAAAGASTTDLYLSSGGAAAPWRIASVSTGAIAVGGEIVLAGKAPLTSAIPGGSYWVVAMSDHNNAVQETNESNNNATSAAQVAFFDDLSISGVSGTVSGGALTYTVNVKNGGTGNPAAAVSLYLSSDAAVSGNDAFVTQISAGSLAGGSQKALTGTVAVPATVASGSYYLTAVADPANGVVESDESNNGAVGPQVALNRDLQVQNVSATVAAGKVTYSITVANVGNVAANSSSTGLFLSADGTASLSDYNVGRLSTSSIAVGAQVVLSGAMTLPANIPPGTYTVAAIADVANQVLESAEGNNGAVGNQVTVANDLSITGLSGTLSGGRLSYTVKVRNDGTGSAAPGLVLYFSPDAVASSNDYVLTTVSGANITAGTERVFTGSVPVPGTIPSGAYYLTALADAANAVSESNETNNGAVAEAFTVSSDLEVAAVSATLAAGKISYTVTVANIGNVTSAYSSTRLLLSADGTASQGGYSIASISTSQIAPGAATTLRGTAALPATLPSGSYTVAAIADAGGVMSESDETNNGAVGNQLSISNDFAITGLSGTLSNGRLSYTVKVANAGSGSSGTAVGLYFSADTVPSTTGYLITQARAASIPGGSEVTLTGTVTVPAGIPTGAYYLTAVADPDRATTETNENNNGAVGAQFTVNSDLQVESVSATLSAGKLRYLVTVRNNGNIGAPSSTTGLYLSLDGTASASDYSVASISTPPIAAGGVTTLSGTAPLSGTVAPATYTLAAIADSTAVISESNETNNGAVGNAVSISNDLTITGLSGTLSNGQLSYTVRVSNSGSGNPSPGIALYLSTDQVPSGSDYLVTTKTAAVPGGTEVTLTGTASVPAGLPSGTYYLVALADSGSVVPETNESNNGAVGGQLAVNTDLQVDSVSATLSAGKLRYLVTVRNNGNITLPSSTTGLYLSVDGTASGSDYSVASISTPPIGVGGVMTLSGTATLPGSVPPATYTVAAIVDNSGVISESNETNNGAVGNAVTISNDLTVTGLSGTLSNGQVSYSVKVSNSGSGNPSAAIALYFSSDQVPSTSDYLITTKNAVVPGGTEVTLTGTASVPAGLASGSYYLVALADAGSAVPETNESNNGAVGGQLAVNTDLHIDTLSATLAAGKISYSVNVRNSGNIQAASSSTQLYLSVDGTASKSVFSAPISTGMIAPGGVVTLRGTIFVPSTVAPATYYVSAIADSADVVKESNEANNVAVGNQITLSNDLSVTALSGTLSNGQLTYSVKVSNSGSGNPSAAIALYFSSDQTASTSDYVITTRTVPLPGGAETTLTGTVTVPAGIPSGTYYLVALADAANAVAEVNESNNSAAAGQFTVNSDLQIGAVSGTITAGVLSYSISVKNTGNMAAASSSTGVYLSTDGVATASDFKLVTISTPSLPAGTEKILTGKVTVPTSVPPGTYFVAGLANVTGVVTESDPANNGAVGNPIVR